MLFALAILFVVLASSTPTAYKAAKLYLLRESWRGITTKTTISKKPPRKYQEGKYISPRTTQPIGDTTMGEEMQVFKNLYIKLQNLEQNPSILPEAKNLLISFFSEALAKTHHQADPGILALETWDAHRLTAFLHAEDTRITLRWEQYIARRRTGSPRELFQDLDHAKWWLKNSAPNKYVDGAWLGHIHKVTTPFTLRKTTKTAWQILSEELGDGDLSKNHAYIYQNLMSEIGAGLPNGDSADFIHTRHGLGESNVWKAALAQMLISLFPNDFLPEILGFNMHFEMLTWDTMRAIKELKELKVNDYYFLIHISIDNAHSGHTAIAMQAVIHYIEHVQKIDGEAAAQQAWRRVQTGFLLSKTLPGSPAQDNQAEQVLQPFYFGGISAKVIEIFKAKAPVAHKLHCGTRMKIGSRTLVDWLEPQAFESKQWQTDFLDALANTKPWIHKGNSAKSKLIQDFSWKGKMFGAFTQSELLTLKSWIDAIGSSAPEPNFYCSFTGRDELATKEMPSNCDITVHYPVFTPVSIQLPLMGPLPLVPLIHPIKVTPQPDLDKFLPFWFAHLALLESFITIPSKTGNIATSAILQVLRAQYGFMPESDGVAGMDEVRRIGCTDIVDLGLEMMNRAGLAKPKCLRDVLEGREDAFARELLAMSMRPIQYGDALVGMSWACAGLHEGFASDGKMKLLSDESRLVLTEMAKRERAGLQVYLDAIRDEETRFIEFYKGYMWARGEIEACFV